MSGDFVSIFRFCQVCREWRIPEHPHTNRRYRSRVASGAGRHLPAGRPAQANRPSAEDRRPDPPWTEAELRFAHGDR